MYTIITCVLRYIYIQHGGIVVRHNSLNLNSPLHPAALGGHYDVLV